MGKAERRYLDEIKKYGEPSKRRELLHSTSG
jgi:hypothetical protein